VPNLKSLKWHLTRTLAVTTARVSAFTTITKKEQGIRIKEQRVKTKVKSQTDRPAPKRAKLE